MSEAPSRADATVESLVVTLAVIVGVLLLVLEDHPNEASDRSAVLAKTEIDPSAAARAAAPAGR
jgi:hypothetical protein